MKQEELLDTLRTLARHVVRNELVCEHFLEGLDVSREDIWMKARGLDEHLRQHTDWQSRFPGLFD